MEFIHPPMLPEGVGAPAADGHGHGHVQMHGHLRHGHGGMDFFAPSNDVTTGGGKFVHCLFAPTDDASARGGAGATCVRVWAGGALLDGRNATILVCVHSASPSTH